MIESLNQQPTRVVKERDEARQRAERAEADRREAEAREHDAHAERDAAVARLRIAESDNAALIHHLQQAVSIAGETEHLDPDESEAWLAAMAATESLHPGAALLERLRAAEVVVEAARGQLHMDPSALSRLGDALAAYDALKGGGA